MKRKFLLLVAMFAALILGGGRLTYAQTTVFINEIHYDNTGIDTGEAIEIAGPAGTDLTGWSIVLYNGSGGAVYDTDALSGTIPNLCDGFGVVFISYPSNGIQNGAPDGIALVDNSSAVIQFLSYEGTFTAVGGPADGMLSTDIGVSQDGSGAVGNSLQLSGTGAHYEDFTWNADVPSTFNACNTGQVFEGGPPADPILVINEIDYDQPGTDASEFVEIKNIGPGAANLDNVTLELVNGSGGGAVIYATFDLPDVELAAGDYYVVCGNAANVATCDLDVTPDTNLIQNGDPDGVGLRYNGTLLDAVSYGGDTGAPYTEGSGSGLVDTGAGSDSISRCSDGTDTDQNNVDLIYTISTPGTTNDCPVPADPILVINEIDYDQPGTDMAEFVEIKNIGPGTANLDNVTLEMINGTGGGAVAYGTYDLPNVNLAPGDYYVVCGNAANVANCDLDVTPDENLIQNGAPDAVAIRYNGNLMDTVSYEGDTGAPYTEGSGSGLEDTAAGSDSISRCPDGTDTDQNNVDLIYTTSTPGITNDCGEVVILINEVDADQTGTDNAEFIELYDGGVGNTDLTGLVLVLYNGSNDLSYGAFDLDGQSTDANGYFVLCGDAANVPNCDLDVTPNTDLIQNGADAVALFTGDATSFPANTPITTTDLLDALVYDTNDPDDAGLLVLLNPGQPQVDENGGGNGAAHSNQRCPNGSGGARNTDTYEQWEPTPGEENLCVVVEPPLSCEDASVLTLIHDIQGAGATSPIVGSNVVIDGVVVGDFQNNASADSGDLNGFYVQEEDADADANPLTSEGIFIFAPGAANVAVGDHVRVRGDVTEFATSGGSVMTELTSVTVALCAVPAAMPTPTPVTFPLSAVSDLESYEGMLVTFPQALTISEYFNFDRFNEVVLTLDRQYQGTAVAEPGAPANAVAAQNALERITLDDGRSSQNSDPAIHPNGSVFDLTNLFRGGDTVAGTTGVIDQTFGLYRIQPTQAPTTYTAENPREPAPVLSGSLTVASFNVLNYFTTLDTGAPICGPASNQDCRGANNANELTRQRDKIIAALSDIEADVFGLIELENHPTDAALIDLVAGLNDVVGPGTYSYIATGPIGTDAIKVAFIYNTTTVTPVGSYAILDSSVDPRFIDTLNRPVLAQTFMENSSGGLLTVAVNHLKSKGSACAGDPDTGDGQGNCNLTRLGAAEALVDWLAADPTGSGDPDFLIIGDLNSYDKEDPIDAILAGPDDTAATTDDYTDLIAAFNGELAYGYVFDGQLGYLDHGLSSSSLTPQVVNAVEWHINADEPDLLDYNTDFKQPAQQAIYEPNAYRSSDHDPVIVSLDLLGPADIRLQDFTADGYTTITLTYEVLTSTVSPFAVDFYTSTDTLYDGGDALLSSVTITDPAALTVGVHVVTFELGVDADLVSDANESNNDYYVLAVADVADIVNEADADPHNEDNTAVFHGAYKYPGATNVFVHGTAGADTVLAGSNNLSLNGTGYFYGTAIGLRIRVHEGDDLVSSNFNGPVALFGGPGNDLLSGGSKPDYIDGGEGDDTLRGNASPDTLLGGPGNDLLIGGLGNDLLDGGTGNDTASFPGNSAVNANLTSGVATGQGTDTLIGIENLIGSDSHIGDVLVGNNGPNILEGRGGPDLLDGRGGGDTLLGGNGDDELRAGGRCAGDGAVDIVDGGAGNDLAIGVLNDPDVVIDVETVMC